MELSVPSKHSWNSGADVALWYDRGSVNKGNTLSMLTDQDQQDFICILNSVHVKQFLNANFLFAANSNKDTYMYG